MLKEKYKTCPLLYATCLQVTQTAEWLISDSLQERLDVTISEC